MRNAKSKRRRKAPEMNTVDFAGTAMRPLSPTERIRQLERDVAHAESRTDIELVAARVAGLVEEIKNKRDHIKELEAMLASARERLSTCLLEHQIAVAKFKELGAVPQPTA